MSFLVPSEQLHKPSIYKRKHCESFLVQRFLYNLQYLLIMNSVHGNNDSSDFHGNNDSSD